MKEHALGVLEFERVLERVARRAGSEAGRERVLGLRPTTERGWIEAELGRVAATAILRQENPDWRLGALPEVRGDLRQAATEGAVLEPESFLRVRTFLATSRSLKSVLDPDDGALGGLARRLVDASDLEKRIDRAVDEEGKVKDGASADLKKIRSKLRGARAKIVKVLEGVLGKLDERFVVPDASVTLREGRYVVPVRREGKGELGGIVHDESQTGATLFVEPPAAIEMMNGVRDLEGAERREVRRILAELTASIADVGETLAEAFEASVEFDALGARADSMAVWHAAPPALLPPGEGLSIVGGRHPLLIEDSDDPVVPFDLEMDAAERCLVVSGPNTGGKSVFLKATGLAALLTQSGIVPPVGPGTRLPVYASVFADIGDEQSIAQNLSTFSAHLANLRDIVSAADERSLILIDEMGTGTDPSEGAALARAVLEDLVGRGATVLASSHLGELKRLDTEGSGIVNASLQFDTERLAPTYRLIKGRPGRSYGLAIARRLGLPDDLLDRADAYRSSGEARLEEVLERLEAQEQRAEELVHELDKERARTKRLREDVEGRESRLSEAERTSEERARQDARKMLLEARAEVEAAIAALKSAAEAGEDLDAAAKQARRRVEGAAATFAQSRSDGRKSTPDPADVEVGSRVRVLSTGARGKVIEIRGGRASIEVGALRVEISLTDLTVVDEDDAANRRPRRGRWTAPPQGEVRTEVDFRGMRVEEIELELQRALDEAVLEDLTELRIIHGKGTGALRQRVGELLADDGRVSSHRMGGPMEGGAGVTVAVLGGAA